VPADHLLAGAALPPNPGELIESHAMEALLEQAKSTYDLVVIDTPSLATCMPGPSGPMPRERRSMGPPRLTSPHPRARREPEWRQATCPRNDGFIWLRHPSTRFNTSPARASPLTSSTERRGRRTQAGCAARGASVVALMPHILQALRLQQRVVYYHALAAFAEPLQGGARAHGCGEQATEWTVSRQT
jgi:hypothetical protein